MVTCMKFLFTTSHINGFLFSKHPEDWFPLYRQDTGMQYTTTCVSIPLSQCLPRREHRPPGVHEVARGPDLPLACNVKCGNVTSSTIHGMCGKTRPILPQIKMVLLSEGVSNGNILEDNSLIWLPLLSFVCYFKAEYI